MSDKTRDGFDKFIFDPTTGIYPVRDPHMAWVIWQAASVLRKSEIIANCRDMFIVGSVSWNLLDEVRNSVLDMENE